MKVEKIKAYKKFIRDAFIAFNNIERNQDEYRERIEEFKLQFTSDAFESQYDLFEGELIGNIKTYSQNRLIHDYIFAHFSDEIEMGGFNMKDSLSVIREGYEVEFLLGLRTGLQESYDQIIALTHWSHLHQDYTEIESIRQQIEDEEQKGNNDKETAIATTGINGTPPFEPRFDFNQLKEDAGKLTTTIEKIKLYKNRQHELQIWQLQYDRLVDSWSENYYEYSRKYYPNFIELCNLELKQLKDEMELERLLPASQQFASSGNSIINSQNSPFIWSVSDTDLLELAISLHRTNALKHKEGKEITQKEVVEQLQSFFNTEIKDAHSKLSTATNRKKDKSPFLSKLKVAFDTYCDEKLTKNK